MSLNWFNRMFRDWRSEARKDGGKAGLGGQRANRPGTRRVRLQFDALEDRSVPAVTIVSGMDGADGNSMGATSPPNTQMAYGPLRDPRDVQHRRTPRAGQRRSVHSGQRRPHGGHFLPGVSSSPSSVPATSTFSQPFVVYDDNIQRFIIGELETDNGLQRSWLHIAISNDSTPTNLSTGGPRLPAFLKFNRSS